MNAKEQKTASKPAGRNGATLGDVLRIDAADATPETVWVAIVQRAAAGDQAALRALYEQTHHLVFTLVVRILKSWELAEEVTLDVYLDVWRRAPNYEPVDGGSVLGWIMNQARCRAIDRLRFEGRKKRANLHVDARLQAAASIEPEDPLSREQQRALQNALRELTPGERQAIQMAFFSELTHAEVAEKAGEPLGTIKTRIRSGLTKLRAALAPRT